MLTMINRVLGSRALFTVLTALLVAAIVALLPIRSAEGHSSYVHRPAVRHSSSLVNCEDLDVQPCWTHDDGAFKIVYSYQPYAARTVNLCPAKLSDAVMPCLARGVNRVPEGEPVGTRSYHWSRTF